MPRIPNLYRKVDVVDDLAQQISKVMEAQLNQKLIL
jgi:hypothetical protein